MTITLKVVGIFFEAKLELDGEQRVIDVLRYAHEAAKQGKIQNISEFSYDVSREPNVSAISFAAFHTSEFTGRAIGKKYKPGEYFLAEDLSTKPAYSVWQYYVLNADKTPVSRGVKFLDDAAAIVPAGGSVIWRLVSVLNDTNSRPRVATARQAQV